MLSKYIPDIYQKEIKNGYSVNSGVFAVVDKNLKMVLGGNGQYSLSVKKYSGKKSPVESKLKLVSAMSDESPNEDAVSANLFSEIKNIKFNSVLGYYLDLYAGFVKTGKYRSKASSGGFATWLLCQMLDKNMVDGVIHVKESHDDDGILFKYDISRTSAEVQNGSKTRYYPAELSEVLNKIKSTKGKYAVVGIPSFIMELRLLALVDPDINERIKYTIGLICGHQKSANYASALAWEHGIKPGSLLKIDFRKKIPNKSANQYITEFTGLVSGEEVTFTKDRTEQFVGNWGHGFFKSKFSDFTDDALAETADVSLGDAWLPEYVKDSAGTNVLIVRNPDIANLIKSGVRNGDVKVDELTEEKIISSQLGLIHHYRDELPYRLAMADKSGLWRPTKRFKADINLPLTRRKVQDLRYNLSTKSHSAYIEAVNSNDWQGFTKTMKPLVNLYNLTYVFIRLKNEKPTKIFKKVLKKLRF